MDDTEDTIVMDIYGGTRRIVGERVHIILDEQRRPLRLAEGPSDDWVIVAIETFEARRTNESFDAPVARITLRHEPESP